MKKAILIAGTASLACLNAFGSSMDFPSLNRDSDDPVGVSLPSTSMDVSKISSGMNGAFSGPTQFEFNVGTWTPTDFETSSQLSHSTAFTGNGVPSFDAALDFPLAKGLIKTGRLMVSLGIGFDTLQRSGTLTLNDVSSTVNQTAYLTSVRAGLEYLVGIPKLSWLELEARAAIVPTALSSYQSAFGDGSFKFGVPVELGANAIFNLQPMGPPFSGTYLTVGAMNMFGRLADGAINGFGWVGGVRVSL